ncbi:MAG: esterase/lipase family protein [Micromonosporaceae bacterium]
MTGHAVTGQHVPVLVIPGFMAGDWSLFPLHRHLRRGGYATFRSGIAINVGCSTELVEAMTARVEAIAAEHGPVAIVGWSRGGTLGKLVTLARPELVASLITLGSPNVDPLAARPYVLLQAELLARLSRVGVKGVLDEDCLRGECIDWLREQMRTPFPKHVPYTSIYSRRDGVVYWEACLDPDAEHVEVRAGHNTMGFDTAVLGIIDHRLAALSDTGTRRYRPRRAAG